MPLRSVKMKRFIFGFQRRVWCPKWTPLSSSSRIVTTAMAVLLDVLGYRDHRTAVAPDVPARRTTKDRGARPPPLKTGVSGGACEVDPVTRIAIGSVRDGRSTRRHPSYPQAHAQDHRGRGRLRDRGRHDDHDDVGGD